MYLTQNKILKLCKPAELSAASYISSAVSAKAWILCEIMRPDSPSKLHFAYYSKPGCSESVLKAPTSEV